MTTTTEKLLPVARRHKQAAERISEALRAAGSLVTIDYDPRHQIADAPDSLGHTFVVRLWDLEENAYFDAGGHGRVENPAAAEMRRLAGKLIEAAEMLEMADKADGATVAVDDGGRIHSVEISRDGKPFRIRTKLGAEEAEAMVGAMNRMKDFSARVLGK